MDQLRLWTVQAVDAWEKAQRRGALLADGRRAPPDFRAAYAWMRLQMSRLLTECSGRFPVWAWATPKPDLRRTAHLPRGERGVRIEFVLPTAAALLSDFDGWHAVLNNTYLALSKEEMDWWDTRWPGAWVGARTRACQAEIEASWERIFDLNLFGENSDLYGPPQSVQAVVEAVPLHAVVEVQHFTAR